METLASSWLCLFYDRNSDGFLTIKVHLRFNTVQGLKYALILIYTGLALFLLPQIPHTTAAYVEDTRSFSLRFEGLSKDWLYPTRPLFFW